MFTMTKLSSLGKPLEKNKMQEQMIEALGGFLDEALEKEFYRVTDGNGREYISMKLKLEDIWYFEYIKRQRRISIISMNKMYEFKGVFEKLVEELELYDFAVNCRGNLVNLNHIVKIKGRVIYLDNDQTLPLSQKRNADFRERMNSFLQKNRRRLYYG
ncbi:LytTR family transcriptional regulator DNA-binding domain-containing protein [Lachnospiraceae bacterium ZAX-1]